MNDPLQWLPSDPTFGVIQTQLRFWLSANLVVGRGRGGSRPPGGRGRVQTKEKHPVAFPPRSSIVGRVERALRVSPNRIPTSTCYLRRWKGHGTSTAEPRVLGKGLGARPISDPCNPITNPHVSTTEPAAPPSAARDDQQEAVQSAATPAAPARAR